MSSQKKRIQGNVAAVVFTVAATAGLFLLAGANTAGQARLQAKRENVPSERAITILRDNCFSCHGSIKTSGLDLRSRKTLLAGGSRGAALVAGKADTSRLYCFVAGLAMPQMPPGKKLAAEEIAVLKTWIDAGAKWPASMVVDGRPWAFRPVHRAAPPHVQNTAWIKTPIDAFVLSRLESKGLKPAPPATKTTLIRRVTFDLTGLPPTPAEVDTFLADTSPNAYEKVVNRLLASPAYGERWARRWLDLARYADSEGFKSDEMRPNAWRYRDYVIQSLNEDKPYDRFVREQIAGDELYPDSPDALIATGFCRHWADESNAQDLLQRRQEILNDITDTVGVSLLGVTLGCARCHDHKYDPLSQKDYYRLQSFFAAVWPRDDLVPLPRDQVAAWKRQETTWEQKTEETRTELETLESPVRKELYLRKYARFPDDVMRAIDSPAQQRTSLQWLLFHKAEPQLVVSDSEVEAAMNGKGNLKPKWSELRARLNADKSLRPPPLPMALGITDIGPDAPKTWTLAGGVYDKPVAEVQPAFPSILSEKPPPISPLPNSTGRRSALANWLASPDNPLTARVLVNRVWQYHFGRGLVATSEDFGAQGEPPTHPELLDWLAATFVARDERKGMRDEKGSSSSLIPHPSSLGLGWSLKKLHRLIVLSSTYRQAATYNPAAAVKDPENRLLWRFRRQRLEGEAIRDAMLAVSGRLNEKRGGPGVMAELPAGLTTVGYWKTATDVAERNRRSVYLFVKRNLRYPLFEAFDFPDTHEPCSRRTVTTTAPQALLLLNDDTALRLAQAFAGRVAREAGSAHSVQGEMAYRLAFGRMPTSVEREAALTFLKRQEGLLAGRRSPADNHMLPDPFPAGMDAAQGAALVDLCHALFNASEFLYVE